MSKCRSMYAGSSGAAYNANAMHPGNGNGKWQGLVSTTNMRSAIIPYVRTRADSDNRNVVFCMNQLGGVGRKSNMFATTADGVKQPCHNGVKSALENAIETLWHFFLNYGNADGTLILVGAKEYLTIDNVQDPQKFQSIQHFDKQHPEYNNLPSYIQQLVDIVNRAGFSGPLKPGGPDVPHIVGWASAKAQTALQSNGFGRFISIGTSSVFMFQSYDIGPIWKEPDYTAFGAPGLFDWGTTYSQLPNVQCTSKGTVDCPNRSYWTFQYKSNSFPPSAKPSNCGDNDTCQNGFIIHNIWARYDPRTLDNQLNQLTSKTGSTATFYGHVTNTDEFIGFWDIGRYAGYSPEQTWNGPNQDGTDPCTFTENKGWSCSFPKVI